MVPNHACRRSLAIAVEERGCTDLDKLDTWFDRSLTATTVASLTAMAVAEIIEG